MYLARDWRWRLLALAIWATAGSLTQSLAGAAFFCSLSILATVAVPPRVTLRRLLAIAPFVVLMGMPLVLMGSWTTAGLLAFKAIGTACAGLFLLSGADQMSLFSAARRLRVPAPILAVALLAERYAHVLYEEFARLRVAAQVRGHRPGLSAASVRLAGETVGALAGRALRRGERVGQALASRGGLSQVAGAFTAQSTSWGWLIVPAAALAAAGLILLDCWWPR